MADDGTTIVGGNIVFPCCNDPQNLTEPERLTESLVVRHCRECGRRHFEAEAEPGAIFARGQGL